MTAAHAGAVMAFCRSGPTVGTVGSRTVLFSTLGPQSVFASFISGLAGVGVRRAGSRGDSAESAADSRSASRFSDSGESESAAAPVRRLRVRRRRRRRPLSYPHQSRARARSFISVSAWCESIVLGCHPVPLMVLANEKQRLASLAA